MNFKPILFSTPMVKAILEGRKTQTRRIVKPQPVRDEIIGDRRYLCQPGWPLLCETEFIERMCPYGQPGDVLWVRENIYDHGHWGGCMQDTGEYESVWCSDGAVSYVATDVRPQKCRVKPSIHMPKAACRIFLEITDVRVERVQDITEADSLAEGVTVGAHPNNLPALAFAGLWIDINGEGSWNSNPWVWCLTFRRIDKPEGFV